MVSRVLRDLGADDKQQIMVLNDEAHHCYQDQPLPAGEKASKRAAGRERARPASGSGACRRSRSTSGIKQICDLSATPFYLKGSGYNEGYIFPWTVSDFSLMDAIESGIVKVPRTPVDDDATDDARHLPAAVGLRRRQAPEASRQGHGHGLAAAEGTRGRAAQPSPQLRESVRALGDASCSSTARRRRSSSSSARTPSSASSSTTGSPARRSTTDGEVVAHKPGNLALLSNVVDGKPLARPRTILIDSAQLESGEGMKADFKEAAGAEIAAFKQEYRSRNPGADVEKITDEDLLREVMNTVGKKGKLGEQVRCVVSVSMLTEGWDANTVTHILGVRAFGSQLLCEQVVGRGLRRRSYAVNEQTGLFEPEYANVYGIPFQFISSDKPIKDPLPPSRCIEVRAVEGREDLRITFPEARRLPRRTARRGRSGSTSRSAQPSRSARIPCPRWVEMRRRRRAERSSRRATRPVIAPSRSPSRWPSASSMSNFNTVGRQASLALPEARRDVSGLDRAQGCA